MRVLSDDFMNDLLADGGLLNPLLCRVKKDDTLMLSIRSGYINVYYRGGSILKLKEGSSQSYAASFDENYDKSEVKNPVISNLPELINDKGDLDKWVDAFQEMKGVMDVYFTRHRKSEREFQQLMCRENNHSPVSNESEYFICDIELSDNDLGARFDASALKWLAKDRRSKDAFRPVLIEVKYADKALGGSSGLIKHLKDMDAFVSNEVKYQAFLDTISSQFNQLHQLGLFEFNQPSSWEGVNMASDVKPEVVFVLASYNPRGGMLSGILSDEKFDEFANASNFDIKFYVSSFAGYALHDDCMMSLEQFREVLKSFPSKQE